MQTSLCVWSSVRVVYNGDVRHVPGCAQSVCTWPEFQAVLQSIAPFGSDCAPVPPQSRASYRGGFKLPAAASAAADKVAQQRLE